MSIIPKLQSRIALRRNMIRLYESCIKDARHARNMRRELGFFYGDLNDYLTELRTELKYMVADQMLDKRLFAMALSMDDMIRYNRELTAQVYQPVYVISMDELSEVAFA